MVRDLGSSRGGRAVAVAGTAIALVAGGMAEANAAPSSTAPSPTAPTVVAAAPAQVINDGVVDPTDKLTLTVDNTQAGSAAITGTRLSATATVPAGILCSNVKLTPTSLGAPTITFDQGGTTGTCATSAPSAVPTIAANSKTSVTYDLTVNATGAPTTTGTVTTQFTLGTTNPQGAFTALATSNTTSTKLIAQAAPVLASSPPSATIYQPYSFQVVTSPGVSRAGTTTYTLYKAGTQKNSAGVFPAETIVSPSGTDLNMYDLGNGLSFNSTTGAISGTPTSTQVPPAFQYTLVANNGQPGAGAGQVSAGNPGGGSAVATPPVALNDVQVSFLLPVVFSDVPTTGTFSADIYGLSNGANPVIRGNADGTFRPTNTVLRQEFVAFAANLINDAKGAGTVGTGPCTVSSGLSTFPDVSNTSAFCQQIKDLAALGIVQGNTNGTFSPTAVILRQSIAAFIYRTHVYLTVGPVGDATCTSPIPFSDVTASNVFCGDIEFAAKNGITRGATADSFEPKQDALREQTAAFVYRLAELDKVSLG